MASGSRLRGDDHIRFGDRMGSHQQGYDTRSCHAIMASRRNGAFSLLMDGSGSDYGADLEIRFWHVNKTTSALPPSEAHVMQLAQQLMQLVHVLRALVAAHLEASA